MENSKTPVLVSTKDSTNLDIYRIFKSFKANRTDEWIHVFYDQYYLVNGNKVNLIEDRRYIIKNIPAILDEENNIITPAFTGFDNWYNYISQPEATLGSTLEYAIDTTLTNIPASAGDGYIITE